MSDLQMASGNKFPAYVVVKPGIDPAAVQTEVEPVKLDWKFGAMSEAALIDLSAQVDAQVKTLSKWLEASRVALKTRLTKPLSVGETVITRTAMYEAHYIMKARTGLDSEQVKSEMGDEWYAAHCKRTEYYELRITPIAPETLPPPA